MKTKLIVILLLCFVFRAYSQEVQRKDITALRIDEHIKIDGKLDEAAYQRAEVAGDFVQLMPYNGQPSYQATEVRILYDDEALYFGAMLYDHPDSIASYITTRDNVGASDYFVVFIDPNNEGLLSYEFLVTPANSQTDIKGIRGSNGDNEDGSWNAVWQSQTRIVDNGWIVEMRIPYSALRFAPEEDPVWGLNFFRRIRRYNSNNSWNFINFNIQGFLHQSGRLHGLKNIQPPVRLSISPYVAQYAERRPDADGTDFIFKGGMDLKFGISESHTLDMMLIPDFGQIQSDDEELNLSPYELQYDEQRQFFNEGGELFSRADIFYSRRIGTKPIFSSRAEENLGADEEVTYNPSSTQMINATKITGRDKNGWGIGFLNAMTLPSMAKVENKKTGEIRQVTTQPFTNYNVSVIEKTLANNSYASLINTNLSMLNDPYSANVTATQFQLKDKKQNYQLTGIAGMSYKPTIEDKTGYGYHVQLDKIKGKFRLNASRSLFTNTLDLNDLGYMQRNNLIEHEVQVNYNIFEPFSIFKNWSAQVWWENERLYKPSANMQDQLKAWTDATFKNNWWLAVFYGYNFGTKDYFEPRSSDNSRYYHQPGFHMTELNLNSDQDKRISFRLGNSLYFLKEPGRWGDFYYGRLWWKASQRLNITHNINMGHEFNAKGYVDKLDDANIYFGTYDRTTIENTTSLGYTFNTKIAIDCRVRHYWSFADYEDQQYFLNTDGSLTADSHQSDADVNFNAFNIDMILKWEFAPGSELSLAWKNAIYDENEQVKLGFVENIQQTLKADQTNSFSLKLLYYIDYNSLFRSSL